VAHEYDGLSQKWGRSVVGQEEVGLGCETVSREWLRSVRFSAGSWKVWEVFRSCWGRSVMVSALSGPGM